METPGSNCSYTTWWEPICSSLGGQDYLGNLCLWTGQDEQWRYVQINSDTTNIKKRQGLIGSNNMRNHEEGPPGTD